VLRAPSIVQEVGSELYLPRFHPTTAYGKLAGPCVTVYPGNNPRDAREVPTRQIPCQIGGLHLSLVACSRFSLLRPRRPGGAVRGSPPTWARAKCKAYMGGDVRITLFFSSGIGSPLEVSVTSWVAPSYQTSRPQTRDASTRATITLRAHFGWRLEPPLRASCTRIRSVASIT